MVSLQLLDADGKMVKQILQETREPGEYAIKVSVSDLAAGIYIYEIKTGFFKESKKLVVIR
jgi:hypothetical protein